MSKQVSTAIPEQVEEVLNSAKIAYISIASRRGDMYIYPMTYHYSDHKIYMITPIASPKVKLMRTNPNITFIVDNKKIALEACGAMIQGKTKILGMARIIASIVSLGPKMAAFAKKYPGMFTFYARGKYLPDERKLYKYRFIRIDPSKMIYWTGYKFGRYIPENKPSKSDLIDLIEESNVDSLANLLASADEDLKPDQIPVDQDWLAQLNSAVSKGILSEDEMTMMTIYKRPLGVAENPEPGKLSSGEKNILKKWKSSKS